MMVAVIMSALSAPKTQNLIIEPSIGECIMCSDIPLKSYSYLQANYFGDTFIKGPDDDKEINEMILRNYFSDELFENINIINHIPVNDKDGSNSRSRLWIYDNNKEEYHSKILTYFFNNKDSLLEELNQEYLTSQLNIVQSISIEDKRYTIFFNELIYQDSLNLIFYNPSHYLPYNIWSYNIPDENIQRFSNITESTYHAIAKKLELSISNINYTKLSRLCKKERTQIIEIKNAIYDPHKHSFFCFGNFNFSYNDSDDLIYFPVIFSIDMNLQLQTNTIVGFERLGHQNFYAISNRGLSGSQFILQDSIIHIKIYNPDFLPDYIEDENLLKDTSLFTSAQFKISDDCGMCFSSFDKAELLDTAIKAKQYYFNNWSEYLTINDSVYLIYYSFPSLLQNISSGKTISLPATHLGDLVYSFSFNSSLFRIFKNHDEYILIVNSISKADSINSSYSLGDIPNPSFLFLHDKLTITSFLKRKKVERRIIHFK